MAPVTWRAEQILEMAVSAVKAGDFERAAQLCQNAIKIKPAFAEAFHIRGICLLRLQRPFDAVMCFDRALSLKDDQSDCWNNRGIAMAELGLFDSARESFQQSLSLCRSVEPHIMCGGMFAHLMNLKEAEAEFRAALEIEPDLQDAHLKLGVVLLGQGKWKEGWPEYEWRWHDKIPFKPRPYRLFQKWQGEDLKDKTILLYSEQGFGDEIMSLRFVDRVVGLAETVVVEVRPSMVRLAQSSSFGAIIMAHGDPYDWEFDFSSPLLDVPLVLGLTPETMPAPTAYLRPHTQDNPWPARLADLKGLKVGLCWVAGRRILQPETEKSAKAKSIPIELLKPLMGIEGVNWISLQIPRDEIPRGWPILDLTDHIDDFYDTAQLINNLDLVVTVDTSVAHLAGALGKRCLTLVRFNGYWPWMTPLPLAADGSSEPTLWYPSMSLFRQPDLGYWEPAIEQIRQQLLDLTSGAT